LKVKEQHEENKVKSNATYACVVEKNQAYQIGEDCEKQLSTEREREREREREDVKMQTYTNQLK
jgi:hypothetical protein